MDRRNALKMLGVIVVCWGGRSVWADDISPETTAGDADGTIKYVDPFSGPKDFMFDGDSIRNIIISRKDKGDLVIPFKDIVKALEPN